MLSSPWPQGFQLIDGERLNAAIAAARASGPISQQAGTSYTFALSDAQGYTQFTSGSAVTATIPLNALVAFPIGTELNVEQSGAGQVTIAAAVGVTLNSASSHVATAAQFAVATIKKVAVDTWTLFGNLA